MTECKLSQEVLRIESQLVIQDSCPDCGEAMVHDGACEFCRNCGYSPCG